MALAVASCGLLAACAQETSTKNVPWILVRSSPTASTVDVQYFHGDCDVPSARVDSTSATVRITVSVTERSGVVCNSIGIVSTARVRLGGALGNRTIVGSCNFSTSRQCSVFGSFPVPKQPPVLGESPTVPASSAAPQSQSGSTPPRSYRPLLDAVTGYFALIAAGRTRQAYRQVLSDRCRRETTLAQFRREAGSGHLGRGVQIRAYRTHGTRHGAVQLIHPGTPFTGTAWKWVKEGGVWKDDGCPPHS